ncbi:MAG: NADH-quinone oxidoreductase subunit NuoF [Deltaproteobacteria bacterium]|jgi:NADH-quinone oxidoreductase subunit F|nr:NADH-quinone oxidoreductase subunit NuoF [Deltaproteobacteria bacterium]
MKKIASYAELNAARAACKPLLALREENTRSGQKRELLVCGGTGCQSSESAAILENLHREILAAGLADKASAQITGCFGFCEKGPIVKIFPDDVFYTEVKPEDAREIVESHLRDNAVVRRLLYEDPAHPGVLIERQSDMNFYKKQLRIALENCGRINPELIEEYVAAEGYQGLARCLDKMTPEEVIKEVTDSGLSGRGGAGFPTGVKWAAAAAQPEGKKYMVCNADEGDPGAFMDRSILEGDPHSVIEGMLIAAYAFGADQGFVYIRAEYPLAIRRLSLAVEQARAAGLLGRNILGSSFSFDLELKYGAGAFVCGEETALLRSIEGGRGEPTPKPPFPAEQGLWHKPTIINNVETLANVPKILRRGAGWFSGIGSEKSKGTKVFALAGKINNVGLVEVPMGITLREIIYEIGGGIKNGKKLKAVQTGGPSGGCISEENMDIKIDYQSLSSIGSMMGSGGMIVMDEDNCMVDIAKFYLEFTMDESCGKCTPCRVGNLRLHEILDEITKGLGTPEHLEKLRSLGQIIQDTALCALGQTAPNPVLSTMRFFSQEYDAHVYEKRCPAGVCRELLDFFITEACIGCGKCLKNCPASCIGGERKQRHVIDPGACIKCGTCAGACPVKAIIRK